MTPQPSRPVHPTSIIIPRREYRTGPLTRSRQKRTLLALGALQAAGLALSARGSSHRRRAAGLGLMVPGGGHAYNRKPIRAALSAGTSALGLIAWIGTGNHLITPISWLASAALGAREAEGAKKHSTLARVVVPLAVAGASAALTVRARNDLKKQQLVAEQTNQYLENFTPPLRGEDRPEPFVGDELTPEELALARKILDVALQEDDDWSNYDILEQFQPSAVRYEINFLSWALTTLQYCRMPAFHGYLSEAQRKLISKYQQRRVWSYWWLENIWGNLESNPDPVRKQNVMLTGFLGLQIGLYQSATGDMRYTEPGSIVFEWDPKTRYEYSLTTMCDALYREMSTSPWSMIVCEPNWLYAYCNTTAANSFRIHDRMLGTRYWDGIADGFTRSIDEEFHRPDGTALSFKSTRTGYGNGAMPLTSVETRPLVPNLADRGWALMRAGIWTRDDDGDISGTVFKHMPQGFDYGNAGDGKEIQYGGVIQAAIEAGDHDLAKKAWEELLQATPPTVQDGVMTFPGASLQAHTMIARGLFNRKGGWLDLIERGLPEAWSTGPLLDHVAYDEAMVARAETDGIDLTFVLHPAHGVVTTEVRFARLQPGKAYTVAGAGTPQTVTADADGAAAAALPVRGRTEVVVRPA